MRRCIDRGVERLGGCDELALTLDAVLVPEASTLDIAALQADRENVVEERGGEVVNAHAGGQRLDPLFPERAVAIRVVGEVCDARDLEPYDERGVVGDALCVGLGKPNADVVRASEPLHGSTIDPRGPVVAEGVI